MISISQIAEKIETDLNSLLAETDEWSFKIWVNAGKYQKPLRQGNKVNYVLNGILRTITTAIDPNVLTMGINGLYLEVLVPTEPPRTNTSQTNAQLADIQNGQFYFISYVQQIMTQYFTSTQSFVMQDENGENFGCSLVGGVGLPGNIDLYAQAGQAVPISVSITLNFVAGGINAFDVKVYMDGERVPYLSFVPSRSSTLTTDLQSNANAQKHISTSSAYGIQFTCPSSSANPATAAIYDTIADPAQNNTAHFVEVEWGAQRDDVYLMIITSANVTASGAEFAGMNASLGEAYQSEEYFSFPDQYTVGTFSQASSMGATLTFAIASTFVLNFPQAAPESFPFYYYIAGKAYKIMATAQSTTTQTDGSTSVTFTASGTATIALTASDYAYNDTTNTYSVYLVASQSVTITNVTNGFTWVG